MSALVERPDGIYVDGTFGRGGHSAATFGLDSMAVVPLARWDWEHAAAGATLPARFGGFLPGVLAIDGSCTLLARHHGCCSLLLTHICVPLPFFRRRRRL